MKIALRLAVLVLILCIGAVLVFWIGALASTDWDRQHAQATGELPAFAGNEHNELVRLQVDGMEFRARVAGFDNPAPNGDIVLLHGFPETSVMWVPLIDAASDAGYRVVAFDQRGYSPGARPEDLADYAIPRLIEDVFGVADAVGIDNFHLVGHDWGSGVGWGLVLQDAARLQSWTSLSIPHIAAFGAAIAEDPDQQQKSSYMLLFRTPWVPEQLFLFNNLSLLQEGVFADHQPASRDEYQAVFSEPGAMTAALNWYRASSLDDPVDAPTDLSVSIPVLFIWGNQDPAVGRAAVENQNQYFSDNLTEIELDTGHWLMETATDTVVSAVLQHIDGV